MDAQYKFSFDIDAGGGVLPVAAGGDASGGVAAIGETITAGLSLSLINGLLADIYGSGRAVASGDWSAETGLTISFQGGMANCVVPGIVYDGSQLLGGAGIVFTSATRAATYATVSFAFANGPSGKSISGGTYAVDGATAIAYNATPGTGTNYAGTSGSPAVGSLLLTATTKGSIPAALTFGSGGGADDYDFSGLTLTGWAGQATNTNTTPGVVGSEASLVITFTGTPSLVDGGTFAMDGTNWNPDGSGGPSTNWAYVSGSVQAGSITFQSLTNVVGSDPGCDPSGLTIASVPWGGSSSDSFTPGIVDVYQVRTLSVIGSPVSGDVDVDIGGFSGNFAINFTAGVGDSIATVQAAVSNASSDITVGGTDGGPWTFTWPSPGPIDFTSLDTTGLIYPWDGTITPTFTAGLDQQDTLTVTGKTGDFTITTDSGATANIAAIAANTDIASALIAVNSAYSTIEVTQTVTGIQVNTYVLTYLDLAGGVPASAWSATDVSLSSPVVVTLTRINAGATIPIALRIGTGVDGGVS